MYNSLLEGARSEVDERCPAGVSDGSGGRPRGFGVRFGRLADPVLDRLVRLVAELRTSAGA